MGIIHKLDKKIIPKIAAGEVIEGPAGAVKELLENSIDAGAGKITVEVSGSVLESLRVTDNGCGISSDDLDVCFQPFYTSKIDTFDDLYNIKTLGFRGEALASLCAVSSVSIKSRISGNEAGTLIDVRDGRLVKKSQIGMNIGTIVEVSGLFKNIPARRKFLKDHKLEFQKVLEVVSTYALCYPTISFKFYRDGKLILNLPKQDNLARCKSVVGDSVFQFLIPFSGADSRLTVNGYISKPQAASGSQVNQYLFVNNRHVVLKDISRVVKRSYGTLIPHDVYPPYIIFIDINPDLVDVNVHPKKLEISFWDNGYINNYLEQILNDTLNSADLTYVVGSQSDYHYDKTADASTFMSLKDAVPLWKANVVSFEPYENTFQIANTYIASPVKEGVLLVDQHAAHESILYEELYAKYVTNREKSAAFTLSSPLTVSFGVKDAPILSEYLNTFADYGFEMYQVSSTDFNISAVPEILKNTDIANFVKEMLQEIVINGKPTDVDTRTKKTITFLACRTAIKAGDFLSQQEQKNIFLKLEQCRNLYSCPHGRPIKMIITTKELAHFFKRIK
ncbi:DNA mismatch repair endonuclease MutL [candidate division WWE3 bacterium]|uniref:DNA mismatch repair protein MutL n=1 Tax=candidate division WWE3 bacterium TaxID=2053526 RepID=A0A7X9HHZ9_UNCKA|nr:DNA mismatch repair endonuclease MutL [candidate division WWE3 bacterium]